jgi:nicotinate-nucleotide pyrophosphorylase (carboxylating)
MLTPRTAHLIDLALDEDAGLGDVTSRAIFPPSHRSRAFIEARQDLTLCGLDIAAAVFARVDPALKVKINAADGDRVKNGAKVLTVTGPTASLLTAERTALNFIQRLSGVATQSRRYADALAGTTTRVVDTRKTTPGLRAFEKYAVRCGGGSNHRYGLDDAMLIKDNHIAVAGSVKQALQAAKAAAGHLVKIEIEVDTIAQLHEVLAEGADVVLLDNMDIKTLKQAVALVEGAMLTEASGGVTLDTVTAIAETGVDMISIGALTHSPRVLDLGLDITIR